MFGSGQLLLFGVCGIVTVYVTVFSNVCRSLGCRILVKASYDTGPSQGYYYGYSVKCFITSVSLCPCWRYLYSKQYVSILVFTSSCWTKVEKVWRCKEAIEHTLKLFL